MGNTDSKAMYDKFVKQMSAKYPHVKTGFFGEDMLVSIDNDGPCTIILDSREERRLDGAEGMCKIGGPKALKAY